MSQEDYNLIGKTIKINNKLFSVSVYKIFVRKLSDAFLNQDTKFNILEFFKSCGIYE